MRSLKIAAALALLALIPGAAEAQSTFTACYVPKSGTVYRIQVAGTPTKCSQNHVEFSWTSAGAQALQTLTTHTDAYVVAPGATDDRVIPCDAGTLVVSGGYDMLGGAFTVSGDYPQPGGSGWHLTVTNTGAAPQQIVGLALCVDPTP